MIRFSGLKFSDSFGRFADPIALKTRSPSFGSVEQGPMLRSHWLILALAVCALAETGAHFYFRNRSPNEHQWQALKPSVAQLYHPNDCVVIAPGWGDPLARLHLGDGFMPLEKVARAGDESCERIIEVGFLGQRYVPASSWVEVERRESGPFLLSVRQNPRWEPSRYAFIDHLDPRLLQVTLQQGSTPQSCTFNDHSRPSAGGLGGDPAAPQRRFSCPGGGFHWVGTTIIDDEHYGPRRCIWAPPNRQGPVTLHFAQVPLGRKLVGHAGGPWLMVRDGLGPPITLAASISDSFNAHSQFQDTDGWVRFEWDTFAFENTVADVALTITASPTTDQRFCFTLDAR